MHSQKPLFFNDTDIWVKEQGDQDFDATETRTEICELVGLYISDTLAEKYERNNTGLHKDDDLACFEKIGGPRADRIRNDITDTFKIEFQQNITDETNLKVVNFFAVIFNSASGKYQPYKNPITIISILMQILIT